MPWALAGVLAGLSGLATSYAAAMVLAIRESPVVAVAELVIRLTPGPVARSAIDLLGYADKPVLVAGIIVVLLALFALAGVLARRRWWLPLLVWFALAGLGLGAVLEQPGAGVIEALPLLVGLATWLTVHAALVNPLEHVGRRPDLADRERRVFLLVAGTIAVATVGIAGAGRLVGAGRRPVEARRRPPRPGGGPRRAAPPAATLDIPGISPWQTPNDDFYLIDTTIVVPTIEPEDWSLRIHGLVDRELTVPYSDLVSRDVTEAWVTLCCVSNEVGGDLVGNARWSGVRVAELLAEAGVRDGADCVLQTSHDGWTCATPLEALTDDRDALLAVAMNGRPLPIEHGFPVRTVVPGLYGFVSATKWVVDMEVTRFDRVEAYWTSKGWSEEGPVKISSRIDVPRAGAEVTAGEVSVGGVAWHQHTGIAAVEVSLDGGPWTEAVLGEVPSVDTWVQWAATLDVPEGDHVLAVRAVGQDGESQTSVRQDVLPDGATGWHSVDFSARA